jgi:hypothetical protein
MPRNIRTAEKEERVDVPILIKAYGEFWNPDAIDLKKKELWGKRSSGLKGRDINVYEERGVYVLYKDFIPVYVGKAFREPIGARIQKHRYSRRKGPRWDSFSWFGIAGIKNDQLCRLEERPSFDIVGLVATLEALLIIVIEPKLNSRREKFKNATKLYQSGVPKQDEVEDRLDAIDGKLQRLEELIRRRWQ